MFGIQIPYVLSASDDPITGDIRLLDFYLSNGLTIGTTVCLLNEWFVQSSDYWTSNQMNVLTTYPTKGPFKCRIPICRTFTDMTNKFKQGFNMTHKSIVCGS